MIFWFGLGDPFVFQNPENFVCLILQNKFGSEHMIFVFGQSLAACTILGGSLSQLD